MAKAAPYEKRESEGPEAFAAFAAYRDMGVDRSHAKVSKQQGKNITLMSRWASTHAWKKRAHAYDREMDRREQVGKLKGVEDMRRRQTRLAIMLQDVGELELSKMLKDARTHAKAGTLDQGLVMKLIDLGTRLERLNRGEPGEIIQSTSGDPIDYSSLTTEELKTMRSVRVKLRAAREAAEAAVSDE